MHTASLVLALPSSFFLYRYRCQGSEKLDKLPKDTWLSRSRKRIRILPDWLWSPHYTIQSPKLKANNNNNNNKDLKEHAKFIQPELSHMQLKTVSGRQSMTCWQEYSQGGAEL